MQPHIWSAILIKLVLYNMQMTFVCGVCVCWVSCVVLWCLCLFTFCSLSARCTNSHALTMPHSYPKGAFSPKTLSHPTANHRQVLRTTTHDITSHHTTPDTTRHYTTPHDTTRHHTTAHTKNTRQYTQTHRHMHCTLIYRNAFTFRIFLLFDVWYLSGVCCVVMFLGSS